MSCRARAPGRRRAGTPDVGVVPVIAVNRRRAALLVACSAAVVALVLAVLLALVAPRWIALLLALTAAAALAVAAYRRSDALLLRLSGARPADEAEFARLHNLLEGLCTAAGVPKPRVFVIDDAALNAFSTGPDPRRATVVCTTGLLRSLTRIELEAVLAHELTHVKVYDTLVSTLAATLAGAPALLADRALRSRNPLARLLGRILVPLAGPAARLVHKAVGDDRELRADVAGVTLTRYPPGLATALEKLRDQGSAVPSAPAAAAHLWIASPVPAGTGASWTRRFDLHHALDERIQALREL